MLQGEHSAIPSIFIKLPFVIKIFVLSIFELPFYTGFTVFKFLPLQRGDYIQIIESPSTVYKLGRVNNRIGYFHDSIVEAIPDPSPVGYIPGTPVVGSLHHKKDRGVRSTIRRSQPKTVDDLLQRLGLEVLLITLNFVCSFNSDFVNTVDSEIFARK